VSTDGDSAELSGLERLRFKRRIASGLGLLAQECPWFNK